MGIIYVVNLLYILKGVLSNYSFDTAYKLVNDKNGISYDITKGPINICYSYTLT